MRLKELKIALIELMQSKYPKSKYKYYSNAVVENYQRPCFFTQLRLTPQEPGNYNTRQNRASFYIDFMQKSINEAEQLDLIDDLRDLFGLFVKVGDRAVDVVNFEYDYTGTDRNVLEIAIDLEWSDRIMHPDDSEIMETLVMNETIESED